MFTKQSILCKLLSQHASVMASCGNVTVCLCLHTVTSGWWQQHSAYVAWAVPSAYSWLAGSSVQGLQELHMHCTVNNPIAKAQAYTTPTGQTMSPCSREKQRHHWSFQASRRASALPACLPFQSGTEGKEGAFHPISGMAPALGCFTHAVLTA